MDHDANQAEKTPAPKARTASRLWGLIQTYVTDDYQYQRVGAMRVHGLQNPSMIQSVLNDPDTFVRPAFINKILARNIGKGLLADQGESWEKARKHLTPLFTPKATVNTFSPHVLTEAFRLCEAWRQAAAPIDVEQAMRHSTGMVIMKALFGAQINEAKAEQLLNAYTPLLSPKEPIIIGLIKIIGLPFNPVGPMSTQEKQSRAVLADIIPSLIQARKEELNKGQTVSATILDQMLSAKDEAGASVFTNQQIFDQISTLIAAGHETTAVALTFAFQALLDHPEMADKIREEVKNIAPDGNIKPEHYSELAYTQNFLREVLRCYPPAHSLMREVKEDKEINGVHFKKGSFVKISIKGLQSSESQWVEPGTFNPERYDNQETAFKQKLIPFGSGPRVCIGRAFAMAEGVLMLAKLTSTFDFETVQRLKGQKYGLTARPDGLLLMNTSPRQDIA